MTTLNSERAVVQTPCRRVARAAERAADRCDRIGRHLIALAEQDPRLVVGLDFAFSFPGWFLADRGLASASALWALADAEAETWLATCPYPFWGRPGVGRPRGVPEEYRNTDREVPTVTGIRPKSVFQIGGAGAVGTGSLRGMKLLRQLKAAGFSIWPFGQPGWPRVVEIYPRALTGPVVKSSPLQRTAYLERTCAHFSDELRGRAATSDDAFDAAVAAQVMAQHEQSLANLIWPPAGSPFALEGRIWLPPPPRSGVVASAVGGR